MKDNVMTKRGQIWSLPSGAVIELSQPVDAAGNTAEEHTGDWRAIYRAGGMGQLFVADRFLLARGEIWGS